MFNVGIDIAKYKHDFAIIDEQGLIVVPPKTISNSQEGFNDLLVALSSLDCSQEIKIGLEATGHYGSNLKAFLTKHGFNYVELNPLKVLRFHQQISLRRTKTDKVDCIVIAQFISTKNNKAKSYQQPLYHLEALKSLTRLRETYVSQRSLILVKMTNVLDAVFPEFKAFFSNKLKSNTALYILKKYKTPLRISKWNEQDLIDVHNVSRRIPISKLDDLREIASNTIGISSSFLTQELLSLIRMYEALNKEVTAIEKEIINIMSTIDSPTASIPGIGLVSAATIISEFGDFAKFDSQTQCVAYAGLDAGISQSGTKCFKGKMVKRGSSHLRYVLMNVVKMVCIHNDTFKSYWMKKKVREHKNMRVADSHTAKKLIRLIYHLETNQIKFDPLLSR